MPSILDLVNEYYQLEKQKTDAGGTLDQASDLRHQCLKFFLEFDLSPPVAGIQSTYPSAAEPFHGAPDAEAAAYGGVAEAPGAELTGIGSSPIPDDLPAADAAGHSAFYAAVAGFPDPAADPAAATVPTAGASPLDVQEDVLSRTVDDFFSSHVGVAGEGDAQAAAETPAVLPEGPAAFSAPLAGAEPVPENPGIAADDLESLPLEEELPAAEILPDQAAAPAADVAVPPEPPGQQQPAGVVAAPQAPSLVEWASQLPESPAVPAASELPAFPGLETPGPPSSPEKPPAPAAPFQWDLAVPPGPFGAAPAHTTTQILEQPVPPPPEPWPAAAPAFELPLTFDVPQAPAPPVAADAVPTAPPAIAHATPQPAAPEPAPVPEPPPAAAPEPEAQCGPAFAICDPSRVTVHFLDGDVKRGIIRELGADAIELCLFSMDEKTSDSFPVAALKAVFVIAQPGAKPAGGGGRELSVTFKDGRNLKGSSPDYSPAAPIFTLYPEPRQGNVDRVVVFKDATDEVK